VSEPRLAGKPFVISQEKVWEAYRRVKANQGAAGVDGESIAGFEGDLKGNLYKIWNRMSSGTYFPPPVREVEIAKAGGKGVRVLGVPTVADRIAQTVVRLYLEPLVEPIFHKDSYGYRPGRSALDAVAACRERCWRSDWVIDLDIRAFFDTLPHNLVLWSVVQHTNLRWVLLYVERWLKAPLQLADGSLAGRERGTPQGSALSPLLANLFLHYVFDVWMARQFPAILFERYADDVVVHCKTEAQAKYVLKAIAGRLARAGLEVHPDKTRIVYCEKDGRRGSYEQKRFDFLGYTFRTRLAKGKDGRYFVGFLPGVSDGAKKAIGQEIRNWRLAARSDKGLRDLAREVNPVVRGWINYYGHFYRTELYPILHRLNERLVHWAMRKYKRLRVHRRQAREWLAGACHREPDLFVHWRYGQRPLGWAMGAG
jgi:RNA-directed DNA polymerase